MIDFITTNWPAIVAAILATQTVAQVVVNFTATPKDDEFVGKAYKALEAIAGIWTEKAKQPAPNRVAEVAGAVGKAADTVSAVSRIIR